MVRYGPGTVDGHNAFGVNWVNVGYFFKHDDKLNSFQLVLIDRSDRHPGDADIEFNYGTVRWETGDWSGGTNGLGGVSARVGYSNGTGNPGTYYELSGSGVPGSFPRRQSPRAWSITVSIARSPAGMYSLSWRVRNRWSRAGRPGPQRNRPGLGRLASETQNPGVGCRRTGVPVSPTGHAEVSADGLQSIIVPGQRPCFTRRLNRTDRLGRPSARAFPHLGRATLEDSPQFGNDLTNVDRLRPAPSAALRRTGYHVNAYPRYPLRTGPGPARHATLPIAGTVLWYLYHIRREGASGFYGSWAKYHERPATIRPTAC